MAGFVRIQQAESRPNLSFGRTVRLSIDNQILRSHRKMQN
jgi:hypothetical protein